MQQSWHEVALHFGHSTMLVFISKQIGHEKYSGNSSSLQSFVRCSTDNGNLSPGIFNVLLLICFIYHREFSHNQLKFKFTIPSYTSITFRCQTFSNRKTASSTQCSTQAGRSSQSYPTESALLRTTRVLLFRFCRFPLL